jgi:hypothetical protein
MEALYAENDESAASSPLDIIEEWAILEDLNPIRGEDNSIHIRVERFDAYLLAFSWSEEESVLTIECQFTGLPFPHDRMFEFFRTILKINAALLFARVNFFEEERVLAHCSSLIFDSDDRDELLGVAADYMNDALDFADTYFPVFKHVLEHGLSADDALARSLLYTEGTA